MTSSKDFNELSYASHEIHYSKSPDVKKFQSWKLKNTVDYWRHLRLYQSADPLLNNYPGSKWLTIGDGRYGTDANYLLGRNAKVLASDIAEHLLKVAKEDNFISDYKVENAENLSFENQAFDFVFCKEAYHHFPRPAIALYEMIRVAKKGVILIEPNDPNILNPYHFKIATGLQELWRAFKNSLKRLIGREKYYNYGNHEPVGNYVFSISEREIEKVALGLNLEMVAFKGVNDHYLEGVEFETASQESVLFKKIQRTIRKMDKKTAIGLQKFNLLVAIIFKEQPSEACIKELIQSGFRICRLPKNPYIA